MTWKNYRNSREISNGKRNISLNGYIIKCDNVKLSHDGNKGKARKNILILLFVVLLIFNEIDIIAYVYITQYSL